MRLLLVALIVAMGLGCGDLDRHPEQDLADSLIAPAYEAHYQQAIDPGHWDVHWHKGPCKHEDPHLRRHALPYYGACVDGYVLIRHRSIHVAWNDRIGRTAYAHEWAHVYHHAVHGNPDPYHNSDIWPVVDEVNALLLVEL